MNSRWSSCGIYRLLETLAHAYSDINLLNTPVSPVTLWKTNAFVFADIIIFRSNVFSNL